MDQLHRCHMLYCTPSARGAHQNRRCLKRRLLPSNPVTTRDQKIDTPRFAPTSQLRGDYTAYERDTDVGLAHDLFQRRLEADNLDAVYFDRLQALLETELRRDPRDRQVIYELAFTILQNRADDSSVARARLLLEGLGPANADASVARLMFIVRTMEDNIANRRVGYRVGRVNWSINNLCPMICKGCYNPFSSGQLSFDETKRVLQRLSNHGIRSMIVSGGDPLLWEHLEAFLADVQRLGIDVGLDTTGYGLTEARAERLRSLVMSIGLPLDGATEDVQRSFRRSTDPALQSKLVESLAICDRLAFPHVRVHTTVTRENVADLPAIAEHINRYACIKQWSLYQWWGRRASTRMIQRMAVANDVYSAAIDEVVGLTTAEVLAHPAQRREMTNLMIQSSGQVVTFGAGQCEEFIVGNLLRDELDDILCMPAVSQAALKSVLLGHRYESS